VVGVPVGQYDGSDVGDLSSDRNEVPLQLRGVSRQTGVDGGHCAVIALEQIPVDKWRAETVDPRGDLAA
jgi:hypothetical protein